MIKLDENQHKAMLELVGIITKYNIGYLFGETRSGKTLTVQTAVDRLGFKKLLFVTRKKSISSILEDYNKGDFNFEIEVINYESVHKVKIDPDFIVYDEAHVLSKFPKPAKITKEIRKKYMHIPCILMSGTPAIESYSQYFHQFYVSKYSPFNEYKNFYRFAGDYVIKSFDYIGTHRVADYTNAIKDRMDEIMGHLFVTLKKNDTQFGNIVRHFHKVEVPKIINQISWMLLKDRVVEGKRGYIWGDTPAKMLQKLHQIINGTVIIEDNEENTDLILLSDYKVRFIKEHFAGQKIAILYYYKGELELIEKVFGGENVTTDLEEFNNSDKIIALQQRTTEGMNLGKAEHLVYLNFGFSGKDFVQSLDRLTVRNRDIMDVHFIFEETKLGKSSNFTETVYKTVSRKENFNTKTFKKYYAK